MSSLGTRRLTVLAGLLGETLTIVKGKIQHKTLSHPVGHWKKTPFLITSYS